MTFPNSILQGMPNMLGQYRSVEYINPIETDKHIYIDMTQHKKCQCMKNLKSRIKLQKKVSIPASISESTNNVMSSNRSCNRHDTSRVKQVRTDRGKQYNDKEDNVLAAWILININSFILFYHYVLAAVRDSRTWFESTFSHLRNQCGFGTA